MWHFLPADVKSCKKLKVSFAVCSFLSVGKYKHSFINNACVLWKLNIDRLAIDSTSLGWVYLSLNNFSA